MKKITKNIVVMIMAAILMMMSSKSVFAATPGHVMEKSIDTVSEGDFIGCRMTKSKKVALRKISLDKLSLTVDIGKTVQLSVSYKPSNTTVDKTVTWSSSNTSVATVSDGKVTAKKAGKATITAKVGNKKACCKVKVKETETSKNKKRSLFGRDSSSSKGNAVVDDNGYMDVSDAYEIFNTFRTTKKNQWYWDSSDTEKVTTYGLEALERDEALEEVAKIRAKEQWTQFYVNGLITHTRPNGEECFTVYPDDLMCCGENLAWGQMTSNEVIANANHGWAETNEKYEGQGHRRNMLHSEFTKVGIACYVKNGRTCWAMCLGK